jgi:hypothetical protein
MTQSSQSETKQEQSQQQQSVHGEAAEHGHTGEGSASALAHMLSQDKKHRRQNGESDEPSGGSGHP